MRMPFATVRGCKPVADGADLITEAAYERRRTSWKCRSSERLLDR
jgi:hypothetical protein